MRKNLVKLAAGTAVAALAAAGLAFASSPAQALPAGTAPDGTVDVSPASGALGSLSLTPNPAPAFCDGDTATDGYFWQTFISDVANDPATLTYTSGGPQAPGGGTGVTFPLYSTTGAQQTSKSTGPNNGSGGQIVGIPGFDLGTYGAALPDGEYNIGFACSLAGDTTNFWSTSITVSSGNYALGARPAASVLDSLTPGDGEITAAFTPPSIVDPAIDTFTVTAVPQGGGATETATGAGSPITVTGLVNGTAYDVTVTATNTVGTSDPSNTLSATPALAGQPAVQNLQAIPGAEQCAVSWAAPASGPTPLDYTVDVTQSGTPITGSPFTVTSPLSIDVTGLTAGSEYVVTVTANYTAPDFGTPATANCIPQSNQSIIQEVSVVRPPGALILTQRCGAFGDLPAFTGVNDFPGYVGGAGPDVVELPAEAAVGFPGTAPFLGPDGTGGQDAEFGDYPAPDPASYPTYCDLDLGTASLITAGNLAGYYEADGRLNQVSVLDTRDGDLGWTLSGQMSDFDNFGETFEGSYLGWSPVVTDVTVTPGYTQVVTPGADVLPGTGIPGNTGLGDGEVLASANSGEGLGVAILDARILLLIPPTAPAGTYDGDLTLSFI